MADRLRPYDEVVFEMQRLQTEAYALMQQVERIAIEQGFFLDLHDVRYAAQHISVPCQFGATEKSEMLRYRNFCNELDGLMRCTGQQRKFDVPERWILCPIDHARKHGFRVFDHSLPGAPRPIHGLLLFRAVDALFEGDNLVYAIGPAQ